MTTKTVNINSELQKYGIPIADIKSLETPAPESLDYLDLIETSSQQQVMPDCVVESQDRPLLFVVDETLNSQPDSYYHRLCHTLACRGKRSYLARIRSGELHVFPVETTTLPKAKIYRADSKEALSFFPCLAHGYYDGQETTSRGDFVFKQMLALLNQVAEALVKHKIEKPDVLSLVGRALFFRFLCDRKIISEQDVTTIAPEAKELGNCFDGAKNATSSCQWLDRTFNGNFLPLSLDIAAFFEDLGRQDAAKVFVHLSAIARAYEAVGNDNYQLRLRFEDWTDFDFAHIPIGLLSQVYEDFAHKWDPNASLTSVYYTPRNIAATLVESVFQGLPNAHEARVLDPACGAGVFLVLTFRQLYRERWKATETRPSTQDIREILMQQLKGFDISNSALKLAALSLYLTAIELDPNPTPPENLRFEDLQGQVLFNWRQAGDLDVGPIAGSLNSTIGTKFDGQFDVVLSNPPWTSVNETLARQFDIVSKDIIKRRGNEELSRAYHNPNNGPDLPFLWKATEWCKPEGRIAMALPARLLLKQEPLPSLSRKVLFSLLEVNGIINGSNLSDTHVWPGMGQPFMLLLATNRVPQKGHSLHFITPYHDSKLNERGEMWIDSNSTVPVSPEASFTESWLWKSLTIGTSLDIDVIRKIKDLNEYSLLEYWTVDLQLHTCSGYQIKEKQPRQQDARPLHGLPDLNFADPFQFVVDTSRMNVFSRRNLFRTRLLSESDKLSDKDELAVYRAPLVLIKQSPGFDRRQGRGVLSFDDVVYTERFYGYSAHGHEEPELLARYIHLFAHSDIWMYYALMTSSKFGAERRVFNKSDLDDCPVVPLEKLTSEQKNYVLHLSERLVQQDSQDTDVFEDIDKFFARLYGLDRLDLQVIHDTLDVSLPYAQSRLRACNAPTSDEHEQFRVQLEALLCPFFNVMGREPRLTFWRPSMAKPPESGKESPFTILMLGTQSTAVLEPYTSLWLQIVEVASKNGATRIFQETEGGLAIAILNQYRYWTETRARLCAAEIIRRFMPLFEGQ